MSEPRLCSKIVMQRTPTVPMNLTITAADLRGQPTYNLQTEEETGSMVGGQADFEVWLDKAKALGLHDRVGGFLYNYDPETEDIFCQIWLTGIKTPLWFGILATWQCGQGDQTIALSFDGGLEIYRRLLVSGTYTEDQIGRHHKKLLSDLVPSVDVDTLPLYFGTTPKVSYLEHPEKRWCEGYEGATPTPNDRVMALAVNGNDVYMCVGLDVISYSSATNLWTYHQSISDPGLLALAGMGWQVRAMEYSAVPAAHLDILMMRIPETILRGTTPDWRMQEVYEMEILL